MSQILLDLSGGTARLWQQHGVAMSDTNAEPWRAPLLPLAMRETIVDAFAISRLSIFSARLSRVFHMSFTHLSRLSHVYVYF